MHLANARKSTSCVLHVAQPVIVGGKAIGRAGRVIKVKLLPLWLFLSPRWDNSRGTPSPLLFHTHPAFLPVLLLERSLLVSLVLFTLVEIDYHEMREIRVLPNMWCTSLKRERKTPMFKQV